MAIINGRIAKGVFTATLMVARNADARAMSYTVQQVASTNILLPQLLSPKWGVKITDSPIDSPTSSPTSKPIDLSSIFSTAVDNVASLTGVLAESFIKGQQEKQERAEHMFRPVVDEVKRKTIELTSLSPTQQSEIKEQLSDIKDEHKETVKQLKQAEKSLSTMTKFVDSELKQLLQQKIDPKTIDTFCKIVKTSSKVAINVIPALRVFSNLSTAYEAAKVLYPDHAAQLENYVVEQLSTQLATAQQTFSSIDTKSITASFKSRLTLDKQQRAGDNVEQSTLANESTTKLHK